VAVLHEHVALVGELRLLALAPGQPGIGIRRASHKSFRSKDPDRGDDDGDPGNPTVSFRGEKRSNETHASASRRSRSPARQPAIRISAAPAATTLAAMRRGRPKGSPSQRAPIAAAAITLVSRSATTCAIGIWRIAQSTMP